MEIPKNTDKEEDRMKPCLLIANSNAVTYKEVFPLIKEGKLRTGYHFNETYIYETPNENTLESNRDYVRAKGLDPDKYIKVPACTWLTTLPTPGKKKLTLTKTYTPEEYPHYDNYNAIEVSRIKNIPYDYEGVMGVPITILGYDLENVEVIDIPSPRPIEGGGRASMRECLYAGR